MGIFNLDKLFAPQSVAVVGASERPGSVGRSVLENLARGGFPGPVHPVNPKGGEILGQKAYSSLSEIGQPIDLVVVVVAIKFAPGIMEEAGRLGVGGVIVISGGGKEAGPEGEAIEREMLAAAKAHGVRIMGPNCVGALCSPAKLNASFMHVMPKPGSLAFVSQSGATCTAVLDFAVTQQIGFSHFVSIGSMLDVDFGDMIDYLGNDPETSAILLYVESVTNHRKFMSAARAVSRVKPIVLLKVGRSGAGAKAAMSHTGAMAGEDAVYDEAFKRCGLVRVETVGDLFDCAELMSKQPRPKGPGLAIVSNAGGPAVMAADYLHAKGGMEPPPLSKHTLARLDEFLPPFWSHANPLDILGDASPETFRRVAEICVAAPEFDGVLILTCPQAQYPSTDKARLLCQTLAKADFPVFTSWLGGQEVAESRELFKQAGIPTYDTPERAVQAFLYMYQYHKNLLALQETPPSLPRNLNFDRPWADKIINDALDEGRALLTETESKNLLEAYGIPVAQARLAADPKEAAIKAAQLGFPVVLKLNSQDISHKSDAGGVMLNLKNAAEVEQAFRDIMRNAAKYDPRARLEGVSVQPMVTQKGVELILGAKKDPDFGPVILFGMGGVAAEVIGDRAIGLPPLNRLLARRLIDRTKVSRLLKGYRNLPPADLVLLEEILIRLSQLVVDYPQILELDVNPLLAGKNGAWALDGRVVVGPAEKPSPLHLSISPYPSQYESRHILENGQGVVARPIRPEDGPAMAALFKELSPQTIYRRWGRHLPEMPPALLARYTQIDYDREMALVVVPVGDDGRILGVGRIVALPDGEEAEMGMTVTDAWQGKGVGGLIMSRLLEIARQRGFRRVQGVIDPASEAMLNLARAHGAVITPDGQGRRLAVTDLS